jgi:hypothetical protein
VGIGSAEEFISVIQRLYRIYEVAMVRFIILAIFLTGLFSSCKEAKKKATEFSTSSRNQEVQNGEEKTGLYAADPEFLQKNIDFFSQVYEESFVTKLDDLPAAGEVEDAKKPYSGYWYPESEGGTNVVVSGSKTPLAKYDQVFYGGESKAATWEKTHHNSSVGWAGHCNGASSAAERHPQQPTKNVTKNGVTFSPYDIKALLAEIYMSADFEFLAGYRCYESKISSSNPLNRKDGPTVMSTCDDSNPGTLHAVISNWIGRKGQTVIMDQKISEAVWNYPYFKYETVTMQKDLTAATARQYVTGGAGEYVFNPQAKSFAYVKMRLFYAKELDSENIGVRNTATHILSYILELNGSGDIVGGEWVGESQTNHPDFIWLALAPGPGDGSRDMGNPHIDSEEVIRLWAQSAGLDPDHLPDVIKRPQFIDGWGKYPNFQVTLDGGQHGAVFTGKPTILNITRKKPLYDTTLTVLLNASPLAQLPGTGSGPIKLNVKAGLGMNRLQLVWKRNETVIDNRYLRFHVVR